MIDISVYKFIHIVGVAAVVLALGGAILGTFVTGSKPAATRKLIAITHGVGLFLVILGGFGMLARLGINWPWPGWVIVKVIAWLLLGAFLSLAYKKKDAHLSIWFGTLALVAIAAASAIFK